MTAGSRGSTAAPKRSSTQAPSDASARHLLTPAFVQAISRLDLRARTLVDGLLAGRHRAVRRGFSVEFSDFRDYVVGDRPEDIDWKVYARTDQYYVKQYRAETSLRCTLVLDTSASMRFCSPRLPMTKFEYARSLLAGLAWLLFRQRDAVGLVTAGDRLHCHLPTQSRRTHIYQIFTELSRSTPQGPGALPRVLEQTAAQIRRRGLVVVASDFLPAAEEVTGGLSSAVDALMRAVSHLRFRGHDVILLQVLDPSERQLEIRRPVRLIDPESERSLGLDPRRSAALYEQAMDDWLQALATGASRRRVRYCPVSTDQPFEVSLAGVLRS